LYGRGFNLDSEQDHGLYAPAKDPLEQGPYTRQPGTWGYNEICEAFKKERQQWKRVIDPYIQAPYAYNGRKWIGYDDVDSLYLKAKYAREMGLGGAMVWSVETDDFTGHCHGKKYILLNTIISTMQGGGPPTAPEAPEIVEADQDNEIETEIEEKTTTRRPRPKRTTTTTPIPEYEEEEEEPTTTRRPTSRPTKRRTTTTTRPAGDAPTGECTQEGMMAGPDCQSYVVCQSLGNGEYKKHSLQCANGLAFDPEINACNYPEAVPGCMKKILAAQFYRTMSN